jgi:cytochrome c peroxidase
MEFKRHSTLVRWSGVGILSVALTACGGGGGNQNESATGIPAQLRAESTLVSPNASGAVATFTEAGFIDTGNPFFKPFGNGRSCASCHQQSDAWSLTPATAQAMFDASAGLDPLFTLMDGANSPLADISSIDARHAAYSMLLSKGLIRVGLGIPANADFELVSADDPYGYASSRELSLFRRPLPAANLKFLATVMWDARETYKDAQSNICFAGTVNCYRPLDFNLDNQANHAVLGHAQASQALTSDEQAAIVQFEKGLFTAQLYDNQAQMLTGASAQGGPRALSKAAFYFGINDAGVGDYVTKVPFTPNAMTLFDAWNTAASADLSDPGTPPAQTAGVTQARQAIARGQVVFNTKRFEMTNVGGLNDDFKVALVKGTCTTCHNAPNAGSHPTPLLFNIGVTDASRRTADMPLYTLKNKITGEIVQTTDPGVALQSGRWQDIGRFKIPTLRALAARAPYFHDGSANDLSDVVRFYNTRFNIGFTPQEMSDLTAFLRAL